MSSINVGTGSFSPFLCEADVGQYYRLGSFCLLLPDIASNFFMALLFHLYIFQQHFKNDCCMQKFVQFIQTIEPL